MNARTLTPGQASVVALMDRYLRGLLDPFVSLLEAHKLMYFMQEAGEPLRLQYTKGHYGPYAENLRHVLNAIEGHFITGYGVGGDEPDKVLELKEGAVDRARTALDEQPETLQRFERVGGLVEGFESPFGLELLATVHWVVTHDGASDSDEIVKAFYAWGARKKQFSEEQILLAQEVLTEKGWLPNRPRNQAAPVNPTNQSC